MNVEYSSEMLKIDQTGLLQKQISIEVTRRIQHSEIHEQEGASDE
ncbi:hypothetical protein OB236_05785 [Paenibacillus sp. WQ 127069]|uniref:Uncharacterized protein n=1 Tax=Paenibacillus baimaensis TaxID=2982185 RepID=A0ABT2UCH8_9BACL|nr:hypothetical protein [Paenibacillus sp. WQ 127069]MCU6791637.1 hypothetical protein [Paenibacillus sp. WQ 127069]